MCNIELASPFILPCQKPTSSEAQPVLLITPQAHKQSLQRKLQERQADVHAQQQELAAMDKVGGRPGPVTCCWEEVARA